ncbi:g6087 [Coccomyxa elongata]
MLKLPTRCIGALVGTVEGLWLEARVLVHEMFDLDSASHKSWQSPIRYSYYDFRPAPPVNPFVLFNNGGNGWPHHSPHAQGLLS